MSIPTPLNPSNELGANPSDVFNSAVDTLTSVVETMNYQLLGNVECVLAQIKDEKQRKELEVSFENFLKMPIRRQAGRISKTASILRKFSVSGPVSP